MDVKEFKDKNLFEQLKEYITTRIELVKIDLIEKSSALISTIISVVIIGFLSVFILIFLSTGLALYLGDLVQSEAAGFFIVAGIYILLVILIILLRKSLFETRIINMMIKKNFKK